MMRVQTGFFPRPQPRASTWTLTLLCSLWFGASAARAQDPSSAPPAPPLPTAETQPAAPADSEVPPEPAGAPQPEPATARCPSTLGTSIPAAHPCTPRRPPQVDNAPDVASFKTPESPAFMALGIAPSEIQRPSTPTGLKASLVNGFAAGGPLPILQNFALEVAPYWLFPHRKLSYQQVVAEPWAALYRNLALSFATSPLEVEEYLGPDGPGKATYGRFAAGLRMTLWPGTPTRSARQCLAYLTHVLQGSAQLRNLAEQEFAAAWRAEHPEPALPEPVKPDEAAFPDRDALDTALDTYEAALLQLRARSSAYLEWEQDKLAAESEFRRRYVAEHAFDDPRFQRCLSEIHAREGFMAEAASAYSFMVPRGDVQDFKQNAFQTATAWLTLGWVFEDLFSAEMEGSVLGVLRGQRGFAPDDYQESTGVLDAGARLALAYRRFGLAIEGTYRRRTYDNTFEPRAREHLYRAALSLDYHLSGGVWLTGTFGKDFGSADTKPVLALANLQWNFSLDRGVKPDQKVTQ